MCSLEFSDIETQIWQEYRDQGVIVLGLSGSGLFGSESASTVSAFAEQTGATFPLLLGDDTQSLYARSEGSISPYPLDVIIDKTGTVRYLRRQFDGEAMQATIEQLLAQ